MTTGHAESLTRRTSHKTFNNTCEFLPKNSFYEMKGIAEADQMKLQYIREYQCPDSGLPMRKCLWSLEQGLVVMPCMRMICGEWFYWVIRLNAYFQNHSTDRQLWPPKESLGFKQYTEHGYKFGSELGRAMMIETCHYDRSLHNADTLRQR